MSVVDLREKSILAKIVYYGPPLGGKTTSLKHVHRVMDPAQRTSLISLNTERDRTLFFDFLPLNLGRIGEFALKIQGFTVPGQLKYHLTRRYVLRGADAVVFVADSRRSESEADAQSLVDLKENLGLTGLSLDAIPLVLQYNKRDEAGVMPVEEMDRLFNGRGVPRFETVATEGRGVFEAFSTVAATMVERICTEYRIDGGKDVAGTVQAKLRMAVAASAAYAARGASPPPGSGASATVVVVDQPEGADPLDTAEVLLQRAVGTNIQVAELLSEVNEARASLEERVAELSALHDVSTAAAAILDEDRVVRAIADGAARVLRTEHASVLLLDRASEEEGEVRERGVHGFLYDPLLAGSQAGDGSALVSLLHAESPVVISEAGPPGVLDVIRSREPSVRAAVAAPLRVRGEPRGLLVVYWAGEGGDPGETTVRFLGAIAASASLALENARLHGELERFNHDLERKVAERTRDLEKALDDLRALDRLKDDFLSGMSHELMTPLAGIRSSAEILRTYADLSAAERQEFLGGIEHEADRLSQRLADILYLAVLDAGKVVFQKEPTDVPAMVQEAIGRTAPAFAQRRVKVRFMAGAKIPRLPCDRQWTDRVLDHLLDNAAKFSPEGGTVDVTAESDGRSVTVKVRDRGPGIPVEQRAQLFDRFKQFGALLTDKPRGIGAGLPLARRAVEGQGGKVTIEGGPGKGTMVAVRLPL